MFQKSLFAAALLASVGITNVNASHADTGPAEVARLLQAFRAPSANKPGAKDIKDKLAQESMHVLGSGKTQDGAKDYDVSTKRDFLRNEEDNYNDLIKAATEADADVNWRPIQTAAGTERAAHFAEVKKRYETERAAKKGGKPPVASPVKAGKPAAPAKTVVAATPAKAAAAPTPAKTAAAPPLPDRKPPALPTTPLPALPHKDAPVAAHAPAPTTAPVIDGAAAMPALPAPATVEGKDPVLAVVPTPTIPAAAPVLSAPAEPAPDIAIAAAKEPVAEKPAASATPTASEEAPADDDSNVTFWE